MITRNPTLPHQIDLVWFGSRHTHVQAKCNCPWRGMPRLPEQEGAFDKALDEYRQHLATAAYAC